MTMAFDPKIGKVSHRSETHIAFLQIEREDSPRHESQ